MRTFCAATLLLLCAISSVKGSDEDVVGYFLRDMNTSASGVLSFNTSIDFMQGYTHYRLLPGDFTYGKYHFDGLATVLKISFDQNNRATFTAQPYASEAYLDRDSHKCVFFGNGIGPSTGLLPTDGVCFTNPGVNLLPIQDQLWLTIDTSNWGRVDPDTLETVSDAKADVKSFVLNAHPACDGDTCFVQHPCPDKASPYSKDVCFSTLKTTETNLETHIVSKSTLNASKIIQHSHSPCVTEHFVLSKLDSFELRDPLLNLKKGGLLRYACQNEDDQWLLMDRRTNESRILRSSHAFVNNHFWNCFENDEGNIVVETVTATKDYLDNYFEFNLEKDVPSWSGLFHEPLRCEVPTDATATKIECDALLSADETSVEFFDYPTFNPNYKMNKDYRFFYAIAPKSVETSRWFDSVIKIDRTTNRVSARFDRDSLYMTEADFIPHPGASDEDDGILLTIAYDAAHDTSSVLVLDAKNLSLISSAPFGFVVPFHAHGISCPANGKCWTNP